MTTSRQKPLDHAFLSQRYQYPLVSAINAFPQQQQEMETAPKPRHSAAAVVVALLLILCLTAAAYYQQTAQPFSRVPWQLFRRPQELRTTPAGQLDSNSDSVRAERPRQQHHQKQSSATPRDPAVFVIVVVSAHRQGNVSYLANTVESLRCALGANKTSSNSTPRPSVLVVNTQIPPEQHTAMMRLQQDLNHSATAGHHQLQLQLLNVTDLHSELHRPDFVLELARRATGGNKAAGSQVGAARETCACAFIECAVRSTC